MHESNLEVKKKVLSIAKDLHLLKAKPVYQKFAAGYSNMAKMEGTAPKQHPSQPQSHNPRRDQQEMAEVSVPLGLSHPPIHSCRMIFLTLLSHDYCKR